MNHADVYAADELANDEVVDGETGVVCMAVVESRVLWLQVVATIEELAYVSAASSFDDEFAARVIGRIVGCINHKVVDEQQVASSFTSDCVELLLSHNGSWSRVFNIGAEEQLVSNFQYHPWHKEGKVASDPEVRQLVSGQVVAPHTSCDADDGYEDNEVAEVLIKCLETKILPCADLLDEQAWLHQSRLAIF